jgi:DNA-binding LacI/PurR family transcriptional regulator
MFSDNTYRVCRQQELPRGGNRPDQQIGMARCVRHTLRQENCFALYIGRLSLTDPLQSWWCRRCETVCVLLKRLLTTVFSYALMKDMNAIDLCQSNVHWLAERLEEDIRTRRLRAGESYLTTAQAGRQLGISKAMAYRAMKILADRQVLVSHPGRGTFVGPLASSVPVGQLKCIHILLTRDYFQSIGHATHGWLVALSAALPDHNIQFDFVPTSDAEMYVGQLLERGLADGTLSAVILAGCPQVVQEQVLNRGVPALVLGTDYSSTRQLPSIDADQFETGRLAAEYLLARGHRRIALLMREMWFPGDRRLFEGVGRALDKAGSGHEALVLRNLSVNMTVLDADVRRLFAAEDRPTGCVCRVPLFAEAVVRAAKAAGLAVPADVDVVTAGRDEQTAGSLQLPSVCMKVSMQDLMATGAQMLTQLFRGQQPDPIHVILPVELVESNPREDQRPKSGRRGRGASLKKATSTGRPIS